MYEVLLKWGLDTLRELGRDASAEEVAFALEAVKAKNTLVSKRFDHAREACDSLVALSIRVDQEIRQLHASVQNSSSPYKHFMGELRNELHPNLLREYRKLKGKFIVSNDLLAGYAVLTTEIVQYRQFSHICRAAKIDTVSEAASLYRALWEHLVHLLSTMTRISSSDLRFWLTDVSYVQAAELFAAKELELARAFFAGSVNGYYHCLLENPKNMELFWAGDTADLVNTYAQPSATTAAVRPLLSTEEK